MIDHAHREQFRNKLSSIAYLLKTQGGTVAGPVGELAEEFNSGGASAEKMTEMLERFWNLPESERQPIIDDLYRIEDELQQPQEILSEGWNIFDED
jgi:hypothetical protein